MFYDSNVYDGDFLRHLVRHTAPDRIFLGTDYPFSLMQTEPSHYLAGCGLTPDELQGICFAAAAHFLA
jgi:aminocarboxymuconate-semialdehyde decarboxylase